MKKLFGRMKGWAHGFHMSVITKDILKFLFSTVVSGFIFCSTLYLMLTDQTFHSVDNDALLLLNIASSLILFPSLWVLFLLWVDVIQNGGIKDVEPETNSRVLILPRS